MHFISLWQQLCGSSDLQGLKINAPSLFTVIYLSIMAWTSPSQLFEVFTISPIVSEPKKKPNKFKFTIYHFPKFSRVFVNTPQVVALQSATASFMWASLSRENQVAYNRVWYYKLFYSDTHFIDTVLDLSHHYIHTTSLALSLSLSQQSACYCHWPRFTKV